MQTRLKEKELKRVRGDYPQIDRIDENGVQWIELNRGCKRGCEFCYADPNYKVFPVPETHQIVVQIIGEGILYDPDILEKFKQLKRKGSNGKVIRYGLSQGVDYRLLTKEIAEVMVKSRIGVINSKGNWYKGMRLAWDWGKGQEKPVKDAVDLLLSVGYLKKQISVFVLVNWKISYEECIYKLEKLREWGVKIDDCFWDTTKKEKLPLHWTKQQLVDFRRKARKHNQLILFDGYDPEKK